jgi:hypothetical protein
MAQSVTAGSQVTFSLTAVGLAPLTYQWLKNGVNIVGATSATFVIAVAQMADTGDYTCIVSNAQDSVRTNATALVVNATGPAARLINLSILTSLEGPGDTFTLGYVVQGTGTTGAKQLLIRAAGPALRPLGVTGTLEDPLLDLFAGSSRTGGNDNWGGAPNITAAVASLGAFPYSDAASKDAASLASITTPENSVRVSGAGTSAGTVIAEIYDATPSDLETPRLINVSVLKQLRGGLTAGFVIGGTGSKNVLIRAVGPTLATAFEINGVVADPELTLFSGQTVIRSNDNWGGSVELSSAFSGVGAFPLPATSRDAALLANLQPGSYTVRVSGVGNATGIVIVEIYEAP